MAMAESLMTDKLLVVEVAEEEDIAGAMIEEAEMATKAATVAVGMMGGAGEYSVEKRKCFCCFNHLLYNSNYSCL